MSYWTDLHVPTEQELLIGFYDIAGDSCAIPTPTSPAAC